MRYWLIKHWLLIHWHLQYGRLRVLNAVLNFVARLRLPKRLLISVQVAAVVTSIVISALVPSMFGWIFDGRVQAASSSQGPRSATASGDCTEDASAGTAVWTSPGNAFSDNTSYATVSVDGTSSRYVKCLNYGFSIPSGVTIAGIVVTLERKSSSTGNGGSSDAAIRVVKGGTIGGTDKSTATTYTTSDVKEDHGGAADLWGTTFSVSDINASNFGAAIRVQKASAAGAAHTVSVDVVQITVYYSFNPTFEQSSYRWFNNQDISALTFIKQYGGSGADDGKSVVNTSDGGYVVAGTTGSYGAGGSDLWLSKFDASGVEQWTKTLGTTGGDAGEALIQTSDGGFITTGNAALGAGAGDLWISKFDSSGVEQWTKALGSAGTFDTGYDIIQTSDGGYAITGSSGLGAGGSDLWISKFDSSGVEQWTKTLGSTGFDSGQSLVQLADDSYVVAGQINGVGGGNDDLILSKFNSSGVEQWTKTLGGTGADAARGLTKTSDGGFVTVGSTASYGAGGTNLWISKFDSSGVEQWTQTLGGAANNDNGEAVIQASDGSYVVTGYTNNYGAGNFDLWLIKFNSSGVEQWTTTVGGTGVDKGYALVQTADGGYAVTGTTTSFGTGGGWLLKFDSSGAINGCSTQCASQSLTESAQTISESNQSLTETNQTLTEASQTLTEASQSITKSTIVAVGPSIDVGSTLNGVSQDTATTALAEGTGFRLRMTLHVGTDPALVEGSFAFKLQYAAKSGTCDTSFSGETYADVTTSTPIAYYNNTVAVDGLTAASNANDPAHSGHTNVYQEYNESNNTSVITAISAGQDGLWDFALTDNEAPASTDYCFRLVTSAGATLNTYTVIPQITTLSPDFDQTNYRWFNGQDAVPNNTFLQALGGTGAEHYKALVQTSDGGYAVTGYTASYGAGSDDLILSKFDSAGIEQWTKTLGGASADAGLDLIQTKDGGYAVTGYTASYGAGTDMWLSKFNSSGVEQWTKTHGGASADRGEALIQTSDGGYAVTGQTNSYGAGGEDIWLVKFDPSGTEEWTKTLGGIGTDHAYSLIQTTDGGYAVTGLSDSYGAGGNDLILSKFDSSGTEEWTKTLGGGSADRGNSLIQTTDGGYAVTGETQSYGAGSGDIWLSKFDSSGTEQWTKTLGGSSLDRGLSLIQTTDGGYAVTGEIQGFGAGNIDFLLSKFDSSGTEQWSKTLGGSGADNAVDIIQTPDGGYAVAGDTFNFGAGSYDLWFAKLDSSGSISGCPTATCATQSLTESNQSISESNQSISESTQSLTESNQSLTESDQTSSTTTSIQAGHVSFGVTIGSSGVDYGYAVAQTSDGGYVTCGETAITSNAPNLWLSKFDAMGAEQWTKTISFSSSDGCKSIIQTSDGGYATTGYTASLGAGNNDLWISKFDSSGVEQWTKTLGTASADEGYAIIQTTDGGYVTTGLMAGAGAIPDLWISKFDSSGVEQWTKALGAGSSDEGYSLVQTTDGGYAVAGRTSSYGAGSGDIWISKFDSSGVEQWTKTLGGTSSEFGYSLVQTTDGGYAVTGDTTSYGTGGDLWLSKLDSSGVEQWTKTLGGSGAERGYSIIQTTDGGYALTGYTSSYGAGNNDLFISKFDSSGVEQWTKTVGGSGTDEGRAIIQTTDGGYAVSGRTSSYGAGSDDLWFIKFGTAGETPGCSSGCTFQSIAETDRTVTESDQSLTESDQSLTETNQSVTEVAQTLTESYFITKGLWTESAAIPFISIGSQDSAGTSTRHDNPLRLRMVLKATKGVSVGSAAVKLQVAARVGTCDTSFTGESYADVSGSVAFNYYNNTTLADGDWARTGAYDPTITGTLYYENYEESANFTNRHHIRGQRYGLWDISLSTTDDAVYGNYCFRVVKSDNSLLYNYTRVFELSIPPAASQQMRHGRFFDTSAGTLQPLYW